jgi:hypothetical protein
MLQSLSRPGPPPAAGRKPGKADAAGRPPPLSLSPPPPAAANRDSLLAWTLAAGLGPPGKVRAGPVLASTPFPFCPSPARSLD